MTQIQAESVPSPSAVKAAALALKGGDGDVDVVSILKVAGLIDAEREACAKLMEGPPPNPHDAGQFCRLVDHWQGWCECADRAAAIRARASLPTE